MIRTIEVPLGSRSRLQLEDGTIVWLNAGSKFSCQPGFSQKNRQVILEGEGYFEVLVMKSCRSSSMQKKSM